MRTQISLILLSIGLGAFAQESLMPWPADAKFTSDAFYLDSPLCVEHRGASGERVRQAVGRFLHRLADRSGITLEGENCTRKLVVDVGYRVELAIKNDEAYELEVYEDSLVIKSRSDIGALRALSTAYQLYARNGEDHYIKGAQIVDSPRFPWRGLLIDVCRHFMPREMIMRQLDGMELVKMNVLHLHLTEDQRFGIESKEFPRLHELGSRGDYLSQEDIAAIVKAADLRGIRVIPEFDMPGHTTSWFIGHPELASAPGPYELETGYGVFDPTMDPTKESTYAFLDKFIGEMAVLFPDKYMHIGGDENNGKQWVANNDIQVFMQENGLSDNHALQAYFNNRLSKILKKHGKRMIGWDEIMSDELPEDIVIQSWRGTEGLIQAAKSRRYAILSNGYYIDLCRPASHHYANDPLTPEMGLTRSEEQYVLGGEATMWAELVDHRNVDTRIWPRTAAIAERLWSPASVNYIPDMYERLDDVSLQLDAIGMRHLSAREELLRMISGNEETAALRNRVDIIEPVKDYQRHALATHNVFTPLTNLADVAIPDPPYVRTLDGLIDDHFNKRTKITSESLLRELRFLRSDLKDNKEGRKLPEVPFIQELLDWASEAVHVINGDNKWDDQELERINLLLQDARAPFAECELALLVPLDRLYQEAIRKSQ